MQFHERVKDCLWMPYDRAHARERGGWGGGGGDVQEREVLFGPKWLREPVWRHELRPLVLGVVR